MRFTRVAFVVVTAAALGLSIIALPGVAASVAPAVPNVAPVLTDSPASPASSTSPGGSRVGGSESGPGREKPGWVWWVAWAFGITFAVGGFRLWRGTRGGDQASPG